MKILSSLFNLRAKPKVVFTGSPQYWEDRYQTGDNSGAGSYGELARFKADVINALVADHQIQTVMEFGCGDGAQLELANYPDYTGFDVSQKAVELCRTRHQSDSTKRFQSVQEYAGETSDLAMSLDVIYHLVEQSIYEQHLKTVFGAATRLVIVYSSNVDLHSADHVKHRMFTSWVEQNIDGWELSKTIPNRHPFNEKTKQGSRADFFIYTSANEGQR